MLNADCLMFIANVIDYACNYNMFFYIVYQSNVVLNCVILWLKTWHYENLPMQYTEFFLGCKNKICTGKNLRRF